MPRLRRITGKQLLNALKKHRFEVIRIKGSHYFLKHEDGRCTVVPIHSGDIIGPGLLKKILTDCEINKEDLFTF
jgi:predicted RNA binding protein YcfA (HicA-like mRNA interferase family)